MLETHIVMSSLICRLVLILMFRLALTRALSRTFSRVLPQFAHGANHRSYGFSPRENRFEPRHFGYGPSGEVQRTVKTFSGRMVKC
jgi:hypothetical protein